MKKIYWKIVNFIIRLAWVFKPKVSPWDLMSNADGTIFALSSHKSTGLPVHVKKKNEWGSSYPDSISVYSEDCVILTPSTGSGDPPLIQITTEYNRGARAKGKDWHGHTVESDFTSGMVTFPEVVVEDGLKISALIKVDEVMPGHWPAFWLFMVHDFAYYIKKNPASKLKPKYVDPSDDKIYKDSVSRYSKSLPYGELDLFEWFCDTNKIPIGVKKATAHNGTSGNRSMFNAPLPQKSIEEGVPFFIQAELRKGKMIVRINGAKVFETGINVLPEGAVVTPIFSNAVSTFNGKVNPTPNWMDNYCSQIRLYDLKYHFHG